MKKAAFVVLLATLFASCQKDNDTSNPTTPGAAKGSWTVGSKIYYPNSTSSSNELFYVYDTSGNGLTFIFDTVVQAVTSGNYTVVAGPVSSAREVSISAFDQTSGADTYFATGNDRTVAAVTVADGRITKIALPQTIAAKRSKTDSTAISASIGPL